jgi:hypothetical protein
MDVDFSEELVWFGKSHRRRRRRRRFMWFQKSKYFFEM